jgi:CDP-glucose 4,6-dehydratase
MLLAEKLAADPALAGRAFNFSNEIQVNVRQLVDRILQLMNSDLVPNVRNEASHEIVHQYLSAAAARRDLSWKPQFTLDDGLARTIAWYREFLAAAPGAA